jgi:crossover junction endodeoxyribonuclease RuvC
MKPDFILGIDPGLQGALALLNVATRKLEMIWDMPVTDGRVDPAKLAGVVEMCKLRGSVVAAIENVNSRPRQAGMWSFALSIGIVHGCLGAMAVPLSAVQPAQWKSVYGLRRAINETQASTKTRARELAIKLWPDMAAEFKLIKNDGRAEAALLARYFANKQGW